MSRLHTNVATLTAALTLAACAAPRLPPPPPEPPNEVTLDAERIRRGAAPVTVTVDTERDEGRIRAGLLSRRPAYQECFERILPANPEASGRVDIALVVEVSGLIHDATGETTVPALRPTRECVLAIVRALRIEGVRHAAVVRLPIEFENPVLEINLADMVIHPRMNTEAPVSAAVAVNAGTGELTAQEAQSVINTQAQALLGCYAPLLRGPLRRGQQRPQGNARFEITVSPQGDVAEIRRAEAPEPIPQAAECIYNILQGVRFRATGRRTMVRARFVLRPQEAAASAQL